MITKEAFREAEQPARIGHALIREVHTHLINASIGYLYRERMEQNGKAKLAKASKVGAKLKFYSELDFLVEVNHETWLKLTGDQKVALIDHELHHFGIDDTGKLSLVPHDLEEFNAIVRRWGLWLPDITDFGRALADQGDLFRRIEQDNTRVTVSAGGKSAELTGRQLAELAHGKGGRKR